MNFYCLTIDNGLKHTIYYSFWNSKHSSVKIFHKLHSKPKTILEQKSGLQQIWDDLSQTTMYKLLPTFGNVWTHAPRPVVDILNTWYEQLYTEIFWLNSVCCFRRCNKLYVLTQFSLHVMQIKSFAVDILASLSPERFERVTSSSTITLAEPTVYVAE